MNVMIATNCLQRTMLPTLGQRSRSMIVGKLGLESNGLEIQARRAFYKKAYYPNGVLKPMPEITSFSMGRVLCAVIPGLFIGAAISKSVANFLEENDLFVPDDDDDMDNDD